VWCDLAKKILGKQLGLALGLVAEPLRHVVVLLVRVACLDDPEQLALWRPIVAGPYSSLGCKVLACQVGSLLASLVVEPCWSSILVLARDLVVHLRGRTSSVED
jgi:hypothetical protein